MAYYFRLLVLLSFLHFPAGPPPAFALEAGGDVSSYEFHDHLSKARASIFQKNKDEIEGIWQNDRFVFPGLEDSYQIKIESNAYDGQRQQAIFFHPVPNGVKRLRFWNVPAGSVMTVHYGIDDIGAAAAAAEGAPVFVRIWAGTHEIRRIRVPNEKGWKREKIDLGVLSFLKNDIIVTFEVSSEDVKDRRFSFRAQISR